MDDTRGRDVPVSPLSPVSFQACLQPVTPDPAGAITIICQEEEEEEEEEGEEEEEAALVYAGTSCGLGQAGPL